LSRRHALSASSARLASRLSPSRLSASLAQRKIHFRAKRENGAKCDVEVSEPFFKPDLWRMKGGLERALNSSQSLKSEIHRGKEQGKEAKF